MHRASRPRASATRPARHHVWRPGGVQQRRRAACPCIAGPRHARHMQRLSGPVRACTRACTSLGVFVFGAGQEQTNDLTWRRDMVVGREPTGMLAYFWTRWCLRCATTATAWRPMGKICWRALTTTARSSALPSATLVREACGERPSAPPPRASTRRWLTLTCTSSRVLRRPHHTRRRPCAQRTV